MGTLLGPGTPLAALYLPVRINGDVALLKGIMKELLEEEERRPGEVLDRAFIRDRTRGFEAFAADLRPEEWSGIVEESGIDRARDPRGGASCSPAASGSSSPGRWGSRSTGTRSPTIQEIVNLLLLKGSIGKPGAGACPVRGHSNVQGDRTMGIWERPKPEFLDALEREFGFEPPRHHGFDTVEAHQARCTRGGRRSSSRWAGTSSPPRRTRSSPPRRCAAAG